MRCLSMDSQFCEAVVSCGYLTHATEEQKRRKIDLVDFITESSA